MAGILHEFVQNTKILASQVNENFATVQNDMEELGAGINTNLTNEITKAKSDLLEDIENISTTLTNGKVNISANNFDATGKAAILDLVAPNYGAGYSVWSGWTAPNAGWLVITTYSGEANPGYWYISGAQVAQNNQGTGGNGRAGGLWITTLVFIRRGQYLTLGGNSSGGAVFYPCVGN